MIAAAPATCGAAIEVPLCSTYVPPACAAMMSTPGAVRSGLIAWSPSRGPRLENPATWSWSSTAPTVRAASALPGLETGARLPLLPAEMTNKVPVRSDSVFTACSTGSSSGVSVLPRLRLTTLALTSVAAHSMPARIAESRAPRLPPTLPMRSGWSGS